jgi:predicted dehydrogenase
MKLRALVVGLGQIGMEYDLQEDPSNYILTHARAFHSHPNFTLVGGVDTNHSRLIIFREKYHCKGYNNLLIALTELQPQVVAVSVPTYLHYQIINQILDFNCIKVILCEKPLDYSLTQASSIINNCRSKDVKLFVNYMRRSDRAVKEIKRRIETGLIAQPIKGVCWYSKGIIHNGSHFLNLLQYWLGEVIDFKMINYGRTLENNDLEPDVKFFFDCGAVIFLAAKEEHYSHYSIELISKSGRLHYQQGGQKISWQNVVEDPIYNNYKSLESIETSMFSDLNKIQWHVVDQIHANLNGIESSLCDAEDALQTLKVLSKISSTVP